VEEIVELRNCGIEKFWKYGEELEEIVTVFPHIVSALE